MTESALVPVAGMTPAAIMERVVIVGDLAKLNEQERVAYYFRVCESLGLNPLTRPFDYITLNGKLTLYPNKDAAAQLRKLQRVSITELRGELIGDVYTVTVAGTSGGRTDIATGAVNVKGLAGENIANAYMKAETKAKRRLSLSLAGLGFADESEIEDLPADPGPPERKTLAERAAEKAAEIAAPATPATPAEALAKTPEEAAEAVAVKRAERRADVLEAIGGEVDETPAAGEPGLSVEAFKELCILRGKSTVAIAKAIECGPDMVGARVKAMSPVERGVLADELGVEWRA